MSLQVWLPLTGDLSNNGINDLEPIQTTAPTYVDGKLGKAMSTGALYLPAKDVAKFYNNNAMSFAFWIYPVGTSGSGPIIGKERMSAGDNRMFTIFQYPGPNDLHLSWQSNESSTTFLGGVLYGVFPSGTWTHCAITYDGAKATVYINGVYQTSWNGVSTRTNFTYDVPIPSTSIRYLNDFRIYDHALSPKEVKEISKGLVAHYTLGDRYASENLIINGFGELGSENWESPSLISTTEIPSTIDTNIKESFYNGNIIKEFIPLGRYNTYTISAYIKAMSGATNYSYPSIFPYDVDKNFIATFNCLEGFSSTYKTTLSQPLQKGDTVIHATDLSAWTTGDNYYFHVAIFGYKNSFGYTYPDMEYTQDSPKFGSRTDKSNINKTNNTITLLSAYTGENRPAGTVICQATEGSTYWYPFGGINPSTVPDWTFKTCTFTPNSVNRLRWATYVKYMAYYSVYHAGIKLVDNTDTDRIIYDCSGYNNHATQWAYDTNGSIVNTTPTPRYSFATFINSVVSTGSGAGQASGTRYIYGNCTLKAPDRLTVAFWCNPIKGYGNSTGQGQLSLTNYAIGNNAGVDYQNAPLNHRDNGFDVNSADGTIHRRLSVIFTKDEWHHYAVTYDGRYARMYKDGIETASVDMGSNVALGDMCGIVLGFSKAGGVWRNNQSKYSDFRLYSTCLSIDDIKELYQTSANIDKNGNFYAYELKEE